MAKSILGTPERKIIKLGDKDYNLSPLNLNVMADIEDEFDCSIEKIGKVLNKKRMSTMRKLIYILLKQEYPDMTLETIGGFVNSSNIAEVSESLAEVLKGE